MLIPIIVIGVILIIVFGVILIGIVTLIIFHLKQKQYTDFVVNNSISLSKLNEINSRYSFNYIENYDQVHDYDNETFYSIISCRDYLIYQLQYIKKNVLNEIAKANINYQLYSNYIEEINAITEYGQFLSSPKKLSLNKLIKKEKRIFQNNIYRPPITHFYLRVTLYCTRLNGKRYYYKNAEFSADTIIQLINRINDKNKNFYKDREIWDAICRVERGKVSNKMRFAIYARDGYRCRYCGATEKQDDLEIDHIIPIAKGGKTTFDNLQTLCHNCNYKKSDNLYL